MAVTKDTIRELAELLHAAIEKLEEIEHRLKDIDGRLRRIETGQTKVKAKVRPG